MLAVGTPTMIGGYLFFSRLKRWDLKLFLLSAKISAVLMTTIAIGYCLLDYPRHNPFFVSYGTMLGSVVVILAALAGVMWLINRFGTPDNQRDRDGPKMVLILLWMGLILALTAYNFTPAAPFRIQQEGIPVLARLLTAFAVTAVFVGFALIGVLTGSLGAGYSLSLALTLYFGGSQLDYLSLWTGMFEFFEITSREVRLVLMIVSGLAGSGDLFKLVAGQLFD